LKQIFHINNIEEFEGEFRRLEQLYSNIITRIENFDMLLDVLESDAVDERKDIFLIFNNESIEENYIKLKEFYYNTEKKIYLIELIRAYFHRFNNNFSIILGYLDYANVLEDYDEVKKSLRKSLESLEKELNNSSKIHNFIKNAGKENVEFNLTELVRNVLYILRIYVIEKEISLKLKGDYYFEIHNNYGYCQYILYKLLYAVFALGKEESVVYIDFKEGRKFVFMEIKFSSQQSFEDIIYVNSINELNKVKLEYRSNSVEIFKVRKLIEFIKGYLKWNIKRKSIILEISFAKNLDI